MSNFKEDSIKFENLSKYKYYCQKCGHPMVISPATDKVLCNHCHNYIFKNKKDEFLFRLNSAQIQNKNRQNKNIVI